MLASLALASYYLFLEALKLEAPEIPPQALSRQVQPHRPQPPLLLLPFLWLLSPGSPFLLHFQFWLPFLRPPDRSFDA